MAVNVGETHGTSMLKDTAKALLTFGATWSVNLMSVPPPSPDAAVYAMGIPGPATGLIQQMSTIVS